jgi:HisJ family histidinol phosphate phosphatase
MMVSDHMNYLTFEDPAAVNLVRRALKLAQAGDLYGAAETANVDVAHAKVVSDGLRRGMRYSIGAEVDNDPRSRPDAQNIVDSMKPDGMIRSVHFLTIDHPQHGAGWNWGFDNPEFAALWEHVGTEKAWELYIAAVLDAIERLPGNILGHFYVPAVFGHWPDDTTLERYEDQVIEALAARGMAVEINSRFLYRRPEEDENRAKFIAANTRLLKKAKAAGVPITVGADAHSPRDQGNAYDVVLRMLDDADVNELVFPIGGKFARVQLRPEVRAEPERPPVQPAPAPVAAPEQAEPAAEEAAPETLASETLPSEARAPRTGSARTTASPAAGDDRPTKARTGSRRAAARTADETPQVAEASPVAEAVPAVEAAPAVEEPEIAEASPVAETPVAPAPEPAPIRKPRRSPIAPPAVAAKSKAEPPKAAAKPEPKKASAARAAAPVKAAPKAKAPAKKAAPVKAAAKAVVAKPAAKAKPKPGKSAAKPAAKAKPLAKPAPAKTAAPRPTKAAAKAAPVKKAPVKKASPKKAPAKKAPPKRR